MIAGNDVMPHERNPRIPSTQAVMAEPDLGALAAMHEIMKVSIQRRNHEIAFVPRCIRTVSDNWRTGVSSLISPADRSCSVPGRHPPPAPREAGRAGDPKRRCRRYWRSLHAWFRPLFEM